MKKKSLIVSLLLAMYMLTAYVQIDTMAVKAEETAAASDGRCSEMNELPFFALKQSVTGEFS
ncbi:MAG: hypothetical protein Q4D04_11150, partial [Clostridia bacterium]|nr:hypothetical protein [Clostridia bacterium]